MMASTDVRVLVHNIRSAHNVGSIFRTADAFGIHRIYLSGYSPLPIDRFGFLQREIQKTALGAERNIPWENVSSPSRLIEMLRREGFSIVGIEQDTRSVDYREFRPSRRMLLLVGNEVRGISSALRRRCDVLISIPMRGKKESLNVSVAFGVVVSRLTDG
jgi:tRNA G18 (ribose-2'-O)-methylase SpoU